ncbi:flagellar hook-basal body complex protein FliE [Dyella sp. KULCS107]|uniref:flagellar hook-basal body complex protein FliE n=1 Tax=Dyella sp. KULCS107 TaxID=3422216 RepID=UPI003D6DFA46
MTTIDVNSLLSQMRQMSAQVRSPEVAFSSTALPAATPASGASPFGALLKQSIAAVGDSQATAGRMAAAFERGDQGADLARTMVAIQKADLSLNAMTQVRNKLVDAYKDIMNMPV